MPEHFDHGHIHTTPDGRHFRHGDGVEVDGEGIPFRGYLAPAFRDDPLASDWDAYLAEHCDYTADDFGGAYAWEAPVPPREQWADEVRQLNAHCADQWYERDIRELNRIQAERGCDMPELSDPTPRQRAQAILDCDDPPVGDDLELCRRIAR